MRNPIRFDLPGGPATAVRSEVELLVLGAPGLRGPVVFAFENEPSARDFAATLRQVWPRAQVILAPFSGSAGSPQPAMEAYG